MKKVKWIKGGDIHRVATFSFVLFFLLFFTGCATITSLILPKPPREKTAEELAAGGMTYLRKGDYYKSAESFQQIKDRYPFSQYSLLAALKLADIHYHRKEYEEAISAYQEFEKLHPTNEALPYVTYQIGMSYFRQMLGVDRDQAATKNALNEFTPLLNTYPDSPYVIEAKEKIRQCRERLAEHELYVGRFYLRTEQYKAALNRLRRLVSDYPEHSASEKARALF